MGGRAFLSGLLATPAVFKIDALPALLFAHLHDSAIGRDARRHLARWTKA
jgi:hypothetical protein